MDYKLPIKRTGYNPIAKAQIRALSDASHFYFKQGQRHPLEIYNVSLREVWKNLSDLIDLVLEISDKLLYLPTHDVRDWKLEVVRILDHTLDSIAQHIDSCRLIIHCCHEEKCKKIVDKSIRRFNKAIKPYTNHVCKIVNFIKHRQSIIRIIYFHDPGVFVPGYYIEGVVQEGVIGPDPEIHQDSNCAISFYRDIPVHVCNLYHVSSVLANELRRCTGLSPNEHNKPEAIDDKQLEILKKTSLLPLMFFPDEILKPVPLIKYVSRNSESSPSVKIQFPAKYQKAKTVPPECRVTASSQVEETSRIIKMPYFGNNYAD